MTVYLQDADFTLYCGDALEELRTLPDGSVHCALTSPPFFGLRDYGTGSWEGGHAECDHQGPPKRTQAGFNERYFGKEFAEDKQAETREVYRDLCGKCGARRVDQQIGLEATPDEWVARLVAVFREVRRVLRDDGTFWLEVGDSYASGEIGRHDRSEGYEGEFARTGTQGKRQQRPRPVDLKPKDLLGQPWLLAFALRADGWYLRQCIIWAKPNAMPESVRDRCTTAHSYVFLFSKRPRYFFDSEAIAEPAEWARWGDQTVPKYEGTETASGWMQPKTKADLESKYVNPGNRSNNGKYDGAEPMRRGFEQRLERADGRKNARSVWQIPTSGFSEAHFATWPPALVERIIRAGTSERGACPVCGAQWVREVEAGYEPTTRTPAPNKGHLGAFQERAANMTRDGFVPNRDRITQTLGWKPSCDHGHEPIPTTVLDPFMGSGTTALVARKLGRRSIGVELNADYCEMAARRLQQLSLLA